MIIEALGIVIAIFMAIFLFIPVMLDIILSLFNTRLSYEIKYDNDNFVAACIVISIAFIFIVLLFV